MPLIALFENGTFSCSAAVIDDRYALTAAHCLVDEHGHMTKAPMNITSADGEVNVPVVAAAINLRTDVAAIKGDFKAFNKFKLSKTGFMGQPQSPYVTCGFAYGHFPEVCLPFILVSVYGFEMMGGGSLFPGMSGGPVINLTTKELVGLNHAMNDDRAIVSNLMFALDQLGIESTDL